MTRTLLILAGFGTLLTTTACFGGDSDKDQAVPPPPATPIAPTVGSVMDAPGLGQRQPASDEGGGRNRAKLTAADVSFRVTNPNGGGQIAVYTQLPSTPPPYKSIVVVPGGQGDASTVMNEESTRQNILDKGVAVFRFDPDGRGNSTGEEDLGGKRHQAGLQAVIKAVIERDDIIDDQVGVFSNSFGIVMSSGALANHQTDAIFLIDWEGPSSRDYIARCEGTKGTSQPPFPEGLHCDDEAFWAEREAIAYMADVDLPYQRIQRKLDHVHKEDAGHAWDLYGLALDGASPWVRLNLNEPNLSLAQVKQVERPDVDFPTLFGWYGDYVEDMFIVANGGTPPVREHVMSDGGRPEARGGDRGEKPAKGAKAPRQPKGEKAGRPAKR
jgi:hypothetical protein